MLMPVKEGVIIKINPSETGKTWLETAESTIWFIHKKNDWKVWKTKEENYSGW